ncbi:hypothetical protein ABHQ57_04345 [Tenacibaculum sp. ZH5_bin.1]|uniref:hypothetical protein n=1 Tax=Tenacibaculum TaxID=104267 RepID=UPI0014321522|nr:hypothetical protein [Tenacibaculum mesophilum]KAF9659676.1 hypothetical protein HBA12_05385 [Tenacibaculum mesophilum]
MLFDITYNNKESVLKINKLVGEPMSFLQSLKIKGVGSSRMIVEGVSKSFKSILTTISDLNYGSIEIRPKGIIVNITNKLQRFFWVIPFYKIVVFNHEFFSIHSDNHFIRFRKDNKYNQNKKFIKKMMDLKMTSTQSYFL